jgi:hypothetical protein
MPKRSNYQRTKIHLAPSISGWLSELSIYGLIYKSSYGDNYIPRREWVYGYHLIRGLVSLTIAPGGLPGPIHLGEIRLAFVEVEIINWIDQRVADHDLRVAQ